MGMPDAPGPFPVGALLRFNAHCPLHLSHRVGHSHQGAWSWNCKLVRSQDWPGVTLGASGWGGMQFGCRGVGLELQLRRPRVPVAREGLSHLPTSQVLAVAAPYQARPQAPGLEYEQDLLWCECPTYQLDPSILHQSL